jgi:phytoene dehydrogenase-like protein
VTSATIVGSGPNGLACAAALARAGVEVTVLEAADTIGGGTRTEELTLPGLLHDVCSAVHPMAAGSPFLADFDIEWCWPEVDCAHPLDDGSAGVMVRSLEETARGLGEDGRTWKWLFQPSRTFEALTEDLFRPVLHVPGHMIKLARFGLAAATPATVIARKWHTPQARALFGGVAAHALAPLNRPMSSAVGMALTCACHAFGWPVARGGSRAITDALAADIRAKGGRIETGVLVRSLTDLPGDADAVVFDLAPQGVLQIAGDRLPSRVARAYRRYRHGPAAFKVDFAVEGGVPWTNEACRRAGTVHVAGDFDEIVVAEREINRGRMPERPFVLLAQQYLADPSRSHGDVHPIWSYAHVPSGYPGDATEAVVAQIERFAPGFRERIVATAVKRPAEIAAENLNFIGGDIVNGANTPWQTTIRPRLSLDPYSCGTPGLFICSAATPPGGGVHGMNGYNAAQAVLRQIDR